MDNRDEIRDFLASRRARITPQQAGLPAYGANRRVTGLRREEVAMLAGVSVDYYTRLERGSLAGVSEGVLESLADALQLDEAERVHLFDLARAAAPRTARSRRRTPPAVVRPSVRALLESMTGAPAVVRNDRLDILAANPLGRALYAPLFEDPEGPNHARFAFLDQRAHDYWVDWDRAADDTVGILRGLAGRNPYDKALSDLIGELSTRSEDFRVRWAAHEVRLHRTGAKQIHHPVVGRLDLMYDTLPLPADAGLSLLVYTAEAGSATQDALALLASWAATADLDASTTAAPRP